MSHTVHTYSRRWNDLKVVDESRRRRLHEPMPGPELVIFVGPPYSGKTLYYLQHYATTHERVSAGELFRSETSVILGLRRVVMALTELLQRDKNVVLDDENWSRDTRVSYVNGVQKKVPGCKVVCMCIHPVYGAEQCYWSREWLSAQQGLCKSLRSSVHVDYIQTDTKIADWFQESSRSTSVETSISLCGPDLPTESEGCTVATVKTCLSRLEHKELVFPGLFLQWEAVVQLSNKVYCLQQGVVAAVKKWTGQHSCGRVVVVCDGKHQVSVLSHLASEEAIKEMLKPLSAFAYEIPSPVFFLFVTDLYQYGVHCLPPKPGMLAWLQYALDIDLHHQGSLYVTNSCPHQLAAESAGVKTMKATNAFVNPNSLIAVHCGGRSVPRMLSDISVIRTDRMGTESHNSMQLIRDGHLVQFVTSQVAVCHTELCVDGQRSFGYLVKNSQTLQQYVTACEAMLRPLHRWHGQHLQAQSHTTQYPSHVSSDTASDDDITQMSAVQLGSEIIMPTADELCHIADNKTYDRAIGYKSHVKRLSSSPEMGGMFVTCQCEGTSPEPYEVSALVSRHGSVGDHCCTCPIGERGDCCKHVVAMLLVFKNSQESKSSSSKTSGSSSAKVLDSKSAGEASPGHKSTTAGTRPSTKSNVGRGSPAAARTTGLTTSKEAAKVNEGHHPETVSQQVERSLPEWINQKNEPCDTRQKNMTAESRSKKGHGPSMSMKRQKTYEVSYQMTEEELVQTAKEILLENGYDLDETMSSVSDHNHPINRKMDLFHTDGLQSLPVLKEPKSRSTILVEATPSIALDEELKVQHRRLEESFQETMRTHVADTLVPDTVVGSIEQKRLPASSVSVVPETVDERDGEKQSSKSETDYVMDIDEFLWGK